MATKISKPPQNQRQTNRVMCLAYGLVALLFWLVAISPVAAATAESDNPFAVRAEANYSRAKERFHSEPENAEAAWQFGRACFDWFEFAPAEKKADIATEGIAACEKAIALKPDSAPAHYYLGLNKGRLADTKRNLSGLSLVKEMEKALKKAIALDPQFDFAGPDRSLGMLYAEAPGWPLSVGHKSKARQHLTRAIELAPDFPDNRLSYIEALLNWKEFAKASEEIEALEARWAKARETLRGEAWTQSWADWEKRLAKAKS
ncbi:MAG: TRAP transporter TatT component family protein, partial [Verrucomicrobiota bacterium]